MPKGPLQLVVVIGQQRAILYSNGTRVADTRVSTGTASHPTPTGVFSVIQKDRWHRSNIYGEAPMFYMHRLTWSGVALHEGYLPGHAASHGCIRMPTDFVSRLWTVSRMGMRVVVVRNEVAPHEFAHASLFAPARKPPDNGQHVSRNTDELRPAIESETAEHRVRVAEAQPIEAGTISDAPDTTANPTAQPESAGSALAPTPVEPAAGTAAPETSVSAPAAAATTPAEPTNPAAVAAAAAPAQSVKPAIDPNGLQPPRPAPLRTRSAEPTKLKGQVAVFISRKQKRIYVRHAFVPVFDMPIEIANPEKPLGTHVYTALGVTDGGVRWNVISLAPAGPVHARPNPKAKPQPRHAKGKAPPAPPTPVIQYSDATEALDRVSIPPQARARIAELLTPGSSLVISDEGLGRETGRYTEFIVETRH